MDQDRREHILRSENKREELSIEEEENHQVREKKNGLKNKKKR